MNILDKIKFKYRLKIVILQKRLSKLIKKDVKYVYIILVTVIILAFIGAIYLTFIYKQQCQNFACFQTAMIKCTGAKYISEQPEASWGYEIKGISGPDCMVNVKLLMAKKGELGIDRLNGQDMSCYYTRGISAYPEMDLTKCHGLLKESLQETVIARLHAIILENLGNINESVRKEL